MSGKNPHEFRTRALTGGLIVAVVTGAVMWSVWSNALLWVVVATMSWIEWLNAPEGPVTRWPKALLFLFPVPALLALIWMGLAEPYNPYPTLFFIWMIWANDTGAYLVGKPLGKRKIWPSVSPGKSWEGALGGALSASLVAWASLGVEWSWMGFVMGFLSTAGDLTQSAWKRRRNLKDSGTLLPGHGGIMDRFDGFVYAAPVYVVLWCIFTP